MLGLVESVEVARGSVHSRRRASSDAAEWPRGGAAWIDAPNIMSSIINPGKGHSLGPQGLDLALLRRRLRDDFGLMRFSFVMSYKQGAARAMLRDYVLRTHWRYWEVRSAHFGWDASDPVDDYICDAFLRELQHDQPRTVCLASHDGGYSWIVQRALELGWRVVLVGRVERMSHRLTEIRHPQCHLIDLALFGVLSLGHSSANSTSRQSAADGVAHDRQQTSAALA